MDQKNAIYWYLKCKLSTKKMQFVGTKKASHCLKNVSHWLKNASRPPKNAIH